MPFVRVIFPCLVLLFTTQTVYGQERHQGLAPYLLIGESGKDFPKTKRAITSSLFLKNFNILGQYNPAGAERELILIAQHPGFADQLRNSRNPWSIQAIPVRIAIYENDGLVFVTITEPFFWGTVYTRDPEVKHDALWSKYRKYLISAFPRMRGSFMLPSGIIDGQRRLAEDLVGFAFNKKARRIDDSTVLASYTDFRNAVSELRQRFEESTEWSIIFELLDEPGQSGTMGIAPTDPALEEQIITFLENGDDRHIAFFPLDLQITVAQVRILPLEYRIALLRPDMSRREYKRWTKIAAGLEQELAALLN